LDLVIDAALSIFLSTNLARFLCRYQLAPAFNRLRTSFAPPFAKPHCNTLLDLLLRLSLAGCSLFRPHPFQFLTRKGLRLATTNERESFKMENKNINTNNATFVNPTSVRVSKDGRYLIIALPGNQVLRKPLNYFRAILNNVAGNLENSAVG